MLKLMSFAKQAKNITLMHFRNYHTLQKNEVDRENIFKQPCFEFGFAYGFKINNVLI